MPYTCYFCGEDKSIKDPDHLCLKKVFDEEVLIDPYKSRDARDILSVALKNKSFRNSLSSHTLYIAEEYPIIALQLSMIFNIHLNKRSEWVDKVTPPMSMELKEKFINF